MGIYACSDLHGQHELFCRMLEEIRFSDRDTLYILGDMIDRGPDSIGILKDIIGRKNIISLIGNHELMMYDHETGNKEYDYWFYGNNGGKKTKSAYLKCSEEERKEIFSYITELYLQVEVPVGEVTFLLSHSSFIPERGTMKWMEADHSVVFDTVWNSPWRMWEYVPSEYYRQDGRWHVIGHVPVQVANQYEKSRTEAAGLFPVIDTENHLINIDLGCAMLGNAQNNLQCGLCCMDLAAYAAGETGSAFHCFT